MFLSHFRFTAANIPAYKKFLKIKTTGRIVNVTELQRLPIVTKDEYLKKFAYRELFPGGKLSGQGTISLTSGTTGKPFYFPRLPEHDSQYAYTAEILLRTQFAIEKKRTLGVVCFGLGVWIGGIFTYKNFAAMAEKENLPLTLLPVGPNIDSTLAAIRDLAGEYDQVLLMGYPPFIKEVLDKGVREGVNWTKYNLKLLMAAEGFTEGFRHHIAQVAKLKNPYLDMCNIYGSVELGTMGYEGALSYLIREKISSIPQLQEELLGEKGRMPTIAQYHPYLSYFEERDGEVLCSGYASSIPLVRYRFPDRGGVIGFDQMVKTFKRHGIDILKEAARVGIAQSIVKLPFVYVFERPNNTITYRGANIYADQVKDVLDRAKYKSMLTGRFTIEKKESKLLRQKWVINAEVCSGMSASRSLSVTVADDVLKHLLRINTEFHDQYRSKKVGLAPEIKLHAYGAKKFFSRAGKQAWVMNDKNGKR